MDDGRAPKRRRVVPDASPCFDSRRPAEGPKIGKVQIPELVEEFRSAQLPATKPVSKSKQRPPPSGSKALKPNVRPTFTFPQNVDEKAKHSATDMPPTIKHNAPPTFVLPDRLPQKVDEELKHSAMDIPPPTVKRSALPTFVLPDRILSRKVDEKSKHSTTDIPPPTVQHNAPPTFLFPDKEAEKPKSKSSAFRSLQAPDIPAFLTSWPKMQPLPPPVFTPMKPNGCSLKSLPPPLPLPVPPESTSDKSMRTISTTEIARATDLFTESGTAELAHIFLHDQHPEVVNRQTEDPFIGNIGLSPHKSKHNKGKEPFLRCVVSQTRLPFICRSVHITTSLETAWLSARQK